MSDQDLLIRCYRPGDASAATFLPRIGLIIFAFCVPVVGLIVMLIVRSVMDNSDLRKMLTRAYELGRDDERRASSGR